jgi:Icc protein
MVLLTGDLSHDGSAASYRQLSEIISILDCPVMICSGNHDHPHRIFTEFNPPNLISEKHFIHENWQFITLNSQIPGSVKGKLTVKDLNYMTRYLNKYPNHHTAVIFHHHPVHLGVGWLDPLGLMNVDQLESRLASHNNVRAIIFGHAHQEYTGEAKKVRYLGAPATSFQFKPNVDEFALDRIAPGYRYFEFYPNGEIHTKIYRTKYYDGYLELDYNAWGYK